MNHGTGFPVSLVFSQSFCLAVDVVLIGNTVKKGEAEEILFSGRPEDVRCCAFCWTYGDADEEARVILKGFLHIFS